MAAIFNAGFSLLVTILGLYIATLVKAADYSCLTSDNLTCVTKFRELNEIETGPQTIPFYKDCGNCPDCEGWRLLLPNMTYLTNGTYETAKSFYRGVTDITCSNPCTCNIVQQITVSFLDTEGALNASTAYSLMPFDPVILSIPQEERYYEYNWELNPWSLDSETNLQRKKRDLLQSNVEITFTNPTIRIVSSNMDLTHMLASVRTSSFLIDCVDSPCTFQVPSDLLMTDSILKIIVYYNTIYQETFEFPIEKDDSCTIVDCAFICKEYFTHFLCYSITTQIFIGSSFVFMCLCIIVAILLAAYKCSVSEYIRKIQRKMVIKDLQEDYPGLEISDSSGSEIESGLSDENREVPKRNRNIPKAHFGALMICLILLVSPVNSECLGTTILSDNIMTCTDSPSGNECHLTLNLQAILPTLGSSVCFTFYDNVNNEQVGEIFVGLSSVISKATLTQQYFTSDWDYEVSSAKYCAETTTWCGSNYFGNTPGCKEITTTNSSMLSGPSTFYPGKTTCVASCGCAGCGCADCSDACLYYRFGYKPKGGAWRVADITSIVNTPVLTVKQVFGNKTILSKLNFVGVSAEMDGITYTNIGQLSSPEGLFNGRSVISNANEAYLFNSATVGAPTFGVPGDIQSNYYDWLEAFPYYFAFPAGNPDVILQPNKVLVNEIPSGIQNMVNSGSKFPKNINNVLWAFTPQYLIGTQITPSPVIMYIHTEVPYAFTALTTKVCPNLRTVEMTGCYNCPQGASLTIFAKSDCDEGSARLTFISNSRVTLFQDSITLNITETAIVVPIISFDMNVQGVIDLFAYGKHSNMSFSGVLDEPPVINSFPGNLTGSVFETNSDISQSFSDWWNSLTGPLAIVKYVVTVIIGVIILSLISAAIFMSYRFYKGYKTYKVI
jgi:hypothetical protein